MKNYFFVFLLIACFSCSQEHAQGKKNHPLLQTNVASDTVRPLDSVPTSDTISLDSLWHDLVFEKGGCLTGGQRVRNGQFGGRDCVLTDNRRFDWRPFFDRTKEELTPFLLDKLADTTKTKIHTCPFFGASNGEVAVYCLSKIYLVNWYDLDPFIAYQKREGTSSMDCEQSWLQAILEDRNQRALMIEEWQQLLKEVGE